MKAKEKAVKLVEQFYDINNDENKDPTNPYISREYAKQCALICNDREIEFYESRNNEWHGWQDEFDELFKVRNEINNYKK